ncbi:MAG: ATP-dependent DNA helicase RecG [Gammaproteobacteria bacterium]|nr:MAG: ATP-dependent DNA helicase RecG [Gammaproteobacteria bacterium]
MEHWSEQGLRYLKGVGPKVAEKLLKLGLKSQRDLLFHLPLRYEDRTFITPVGSLQPGQRGQIEAEVLHAGVHYRRQGRSRRVLAAKLGDNTGVLSVRYFYFNANQQKLFEKGNWLRCYGEVRVAQGELEMIHPEAERLDLDDPSPLPQTLTPIYPTTEGLHQLSIKRILGQVIDKLKTDGIAETLPQDWLDRNDFPDVSTAMLRLHNPENKADSELIATGRHPAQYRFIVEELAAHRLALLERRRQIRSRKTPVIKPASRLRQQLSQSLPFELTGAQLRVLDELMQDFAAGKPMIRLVQGDVGSGKTVVAALACLPAIESGYQAALMAPTEILAEQHYQNFTQWLEPLGINVVNLVGADKGKKRERKVGQIASGEAQVVIGTHALFQASVEFNRLGFIIFDEQHRFGVDQRLALQRKTRDGEMAHQLIMTATPIPRTMAMSIYADLDYSQIDELPPGRKPVTTSIVSEQQRASLIQRVAKSCADGGQVYWVCTLIEESEALQCEAAELTFESLCRQLPQLSIGLVHGRMKPAEKEAAILAFKQGQTHILVATTVIEVGVDVPNASIMIIENPERLGLAQIHQLRGRVGRGARESFCILLVRNDLSELARKRLEVIRSTQDGFAIAEKDLELRGAGEVLGTRQTGEMSFRIADLMRDQKWFPQVEALAKMMQQPEYAEVRAELLRNWVGERQDYTDVG